MTALKPPTSARGILAGPRLTRIAERVPGYPTLEITPLQFLPVHPDPQGAFIGKPVSHTPHRTSLSRGAA